MAEQENDFELEISPLPQTESITPRVLRAGGQSLRQHRHLRAALVAGLVGALVLALFAGTVGQPALSSLRTRFSPAPTATLAISAEGFNVVHWAPWGKLLANGRLVPQLSTPPNPTDVYSGPAPYVTAFLLPRGRYTLDYQADPFPPLRCRVSVPAAADDTCPLSHAALSGAMANRIPGARTLDLHVSPEYLPAGSYRALLDTVRDFLSTAGATSTILLPGDHYLDGRGQIETAWEQLVATANFRLDTTGGDARATPGCATICDAPVEASDYLGAHNVLFTWIGATVRMQVTYRYTDRSDRVTLDNAPFSASPSPGFAIPIVYAWDSGRWHVAAQHYDLLPDFCPATLDSLNSLNTGISASSPTYAKLYEARSLPNWLDGCVLLVYTAAVGAHAAVPLLFRCGTLLAVLPTSHRLFPALPLADAYERQLASAAFTG